MLTSKLVGIFTCSNRRRVRGQVFLAPWLNLEIALSLDLRRRSRVDLPKRDRKQGEVPCVGGLDLGEILVEASPIRLRGIALEIAKPNTKLGKHCCSDGAEMTAGSGQYERMPDSILIFEILPDVKNHADRVECASEAEECEYRWRHRVCQGTQSDETRPA